MITQVYDRERVAKLADCNISEIPKLVERGVLPKPLGKPSRNTKQRWSPIAVHTKLGIPLPTDEPTHTRTEK